MNTPYQKSVRQKPILLQIESFFYKHGRTRRHIKKISIILIPALLTNIILSLFLPLSKTISASTQPECPGMSYKIENVHNGTYNVSGNKTITLSTDGALFDWNSSFGISKIFVKGGVNANTYDYPDLSYSGDDLHAPVNPNNEKYYDISYINFCYPPAPKTQCIMELTKTDFADLVEPGQELKYHLKLENIGTANCTGGGVQLKEYYDTKTIFVSASPVPSHGNNLWNFGTMAPGAVREVDVTTKVSNTAPNGGKITNKACFWTREYNTWTCVEEETEIKTPPPPPPPGICENPITINFDKDAQNNDILKGQTIDTEYNSLGITVSAHNNNANHPQIAITFDSSNPSGGINGDQIADVDLGTPNIMFGGPGLSETGDNKEASNDTALHNLLIIPDNNVNTTPADGYIDDPNDEPSGGIFSFVFTKPYAFHSVQFIDLDYSAGNVSGYLDTAGNIQEFSLNAPKKGGNSVQKIFGDETTEIQLLKISATDSYGIDNLSLCPIEKPPVCGNSIPEENEDCDLGSANNGIECVPEYFLNGI